MAKQRSSGGKQTPETAPPVERARTRKAEPAGRSAGGRATGVGRKGTTSAASTERGKASAPTKTPAAKQSAARKPAMKQAAVKQSAVKKAPAKQAPAKKAPAKKAAVKKAPAKKAAVKKAPGKKAALSKPAVKQGTTRKSTATTSASRKPTPKGATKTVKAPARRAAALPAKAARRRKPEGRVRRGPPVPPIEREVRVRALDPVARCGPNTSVEKLYRVDEDVNGRRTVHLVFFDRHGWYCEHGRDCVAVRDARKLGAR